MKTPMDATMETNMKTMTNATTHAATDATMQDDGPVDTSKRPKEMNLDVYAVIDHIPGQGLGIGTILLTTCVKTGTPISQGLLQYHQRYRESGSTADNTQPPKWVQLMAMKHVFATAELTMKKPQDPKISFKGIHVYAEHEGVVRFIEYYLEKGEDTVRANAGDDIDELAFRLAILYAIKSIYLRLQGMGFEVTIGVRIPETETRNKSRWMARGKERLAGKVRARQDRHEHKRDVRRRARDEEAQATALDALSQLSIGGDDAMTG